MVNGTRILDSPLARHPKILSPLVAQVKLLKEPNYGLTHFLPAAKISEIKTFTPTASAKAKAKEKVVAQAA